MSPTHTKERQYRKAQIETSPLPSHLSHRTSIITSEFQDSFHPKPLTSGDYRDKTLLDGRYLLGLLIPCDSLE